MPTYRLTDKVRILRITATQNDFEVTSEATEEVHAAWADLRPLSAVEQLNAQQVGGIVTHRCVIRQPYVDITSQMQVDSRYGTLQIVGVVDIDGRGDYVELLCRQGVAVGT